MKSMANLVDYDDDYEDDNNEDYEVDNDEDDGDDVEYQC